jgi:superfamily I DNA and RNA helicase
VAAEMSLKTYLDGAELLQMSQEYNVHIAVTRSPLALKVEGLRPSLSALSEHITAVKNVKYFISFCIHEDES